MSAQPKLMKPLSYTAMARKARKASRELSHAMICAKCLPDELGCAGDVAEGFAEAILEHAGAAIALAAEIKCSLRVMRAGKSDDTRELRVRLSNLCFSAVPCEGGKNHVVASNYIKEGRALLDGQMKGGA